MHGPAIPLDALRVTTIQQAHRLLDLDLRNLCMNFAELPLASSSGVNIKVRYRQTAVGIAWFALQPILATLIFTLVFGRLARLPSQGVPYAVFSYVAVVPWKLLAQAVARGVNRTRWPSRDLISKVYFPGCCWRLGWSSPAGGLRRRLSRAGCDISRPGAFTPTASILTPLFLLLAVATAIAVVSWLAPINVRYRDLSYTMPSSADLDVRHAGGLLDRAHSDPLAMALRIEPDGERGGGAFRWAWLGTAPANRLPARRQRLRAWRFW